MKRKPHTDHHPLNKIERDVIRAAKAADVSPLEVELIRLEFEIARKQEEMKREVLKRKITGTFSTSISSSTKHSPSKGLGGRLKS
jgi:hypothetical protein